MGASANPLAEKAERVAWWLLAALVAVVPLALGSLGARAAIGTWDPFGLPKAVALIVLASASAIAYAVSLAAGGRLYTHRAFWVAASAVSWWTIATAFSVSPALSVYGEYMRNDGLVAFASQALVLFLAVQLVRSARRLRLLCATLVASATAVALYALAQFANVDPLVWPRGGFGDRIFATYGNPDLLGAFLVFPLVIAAGLALSSEKTRDAVLGWCGAGAIGIALLLSLVRGAWIGAVVGLVILVGSAVVGRIRPRALDLGFAGGLTAVFGVVAVVAGRQDGLSVGERLGSLLGPAAAGSLGTRFLLWRAALDAWLARPVTGWGPDTFQRAFASQVTAEYYRRTSASILSDNAHNYFFQLLATVGVVGAVLVVVLLVWALASTARSTFSHAMPRGRLLYASVWAGMVAMAVTLLTAISMPGVTLWAWLAAGLLLVPTSRAVEPRRAAGLGLAVGLGVFAAAAAFVAASWWTADTIAATAMRSGDAIEQALGLERALALNPLPQRYRILRAAAYNRAVVEAAGGGATPEDLRPLFTQASDAFTEAARRDPTDLESRIQLAAGLNQAARLFSDEEYGSRALDAAREAIALAPRDPDALTQLSTAQLFADDPAGAEAAAEKATRVLPTYAPAWLALGAAREARGNVSAARKAFEKALELAPEDTQARLGVERIRKLEIEQR